MIKIFFFQSSFQLQNWNTSWIQIQLKIQTQTEIEIKMNRISSAEFHCG